MRLLVVEHHLRLVLGDREQQLLLAVRAIVKQLAFGGLGARANVVERGDRDTALADLGGGALDDALSCGLALGRQFLDLQVHSQQRTSGPMSPLITRLDGRTALVTGSTGGL